MHNCMRAGRCVAKYYLVWLLCRVLPRLDWESVKAGALNFSGRYANLVGYRDPKVIGSNINPVEDFWRAPWNVYQNPKMVSQPVLPLAIINEYPILLRKSRIPFVIDFAGWADSFGTILLYRLHCQCHCHWQWILYTWIILLSVTLYACKVTDVYSDREIISKQLEVGNLI